MDYSKTFLAGSISPQGHLSGPLLNGVILQQKFIFSFQSHTQPIYSWSSSSSSSFISWSLCQSELKGRRHKCELTKGCYDNNGEKQDYDWSVLPSGSACAWLGALSTLQWIVAESVYSYYLGDVVEFSLWRVVLPHSHLVPHRQMFRFYPCPLAKLVAGFWIVVVVQLLSMSDSLWPHGLEHARLPCSSPRLGFAQTHAHWVGDAIQSSHPLSPSSPPALNFSQHQGLFKWVSSHQVAKVLELQLQHQSFQWIVMIDFLQDWLVESLCSPRDSQESSLAPQF